MSCPIIIIITVIIPSPSMFLSLKGKNDYSVYLNDVKDQSGEFKAKIAFNSQSCSFFHLHWTNEISIHLNAYVLIYLWLPLKMFQTHYYMVSHLTLVTIWSRSVRNIVSCLLFRKLRFRGNFCCTKVRNLLTFSLIKLRTLVIVKWPFWNTNNVTYVSLSISFC